MRIGIERPLENRHRWNVFHQALGLPIRSHTRLDGVRQEELDDQCRLGSYMLFGRAHAARALETMSVQQQDRPEPGTASLVEEVQDSLGSSRKLAVTGTTHLARPQLPLLVMAFAAKAMAMVLAVKVMAMVLVVVSLRSDHAVVETRSILMPE